MVSRPSPAPDDRHLVLVINPGSTSTRVALYRGEAAVAEEEVALTEGSPADSSDLWSQVGTRAEVVERFLDRNGIEPSELEAVVGRGGLFRPLDGGVYAVNEAMLRDAREGLQGEHPSNLGCALANAVAGPAGVPAFVVDPVSVDESEELALYSGLAEIRRRTLSHALSIHACARRHAADEGRPLREVNVVVAHMGGGISVCPVRGGKIVDANNAVSEGPFSPQRSGGLPVQELLDLAFSGEHDQASLVALTTRRGGLVSYLGTSDAREVEARIAAGDMEAKRVYRAMAYQIAKEVGAMATVLEGRVDAILLTGGLARSTLLTGWIADRVAFMAPVKVLPIHEMDALAAGALTVLRGEEKALTY
ncbi:MAG: butyrate kinase [Gemmatimonadetes bacterium]|nr:butyrate kinase [Gemmatimonadota bacterium]NNK48866.1 butyrate kinase [Gemmatimonadota bacterium]